MSEKGFFDLSLASLQHNATHSDRLPEEEKNTDNRTERRHYFMHFVLNSPQSYNINSEKQTICLFFARTSE
jgi:hypothetical protein